MKIALGGTPRGFAMGVVRCAETVTAQREPEERNHERRETDERKAKNSGEMQEPRNRRNTRKRSGKEEEKIQEGC